MSAGEVQNEDGGRGRDGEVTWAAPVQTQAGDLGDAASQAQVLAPHGPGVNTGRGPEDASSQAWLLGPHSLPTGCLLPRREVGHHLTLFHSCAGPLVIYI